MAAIFPEMTTKMATDNHLGKQNSDFFSKMAAKMGTSDHL